MRVEGRDFFAGITFPVADSFCSLIRRLGRHGDWALEREQRRRSAESKRRNRWSSSRTLVQRPHPVTPEKIEVWLDDRQIATNQELKGNRITIRMEMEPSTPAAGIATWKTKGALRETFAATARMRPAWVRTSGSGARTPNPGRSHHRVAPSVAE